MKKILIFVFSLFLLAGCGKYSKKSIVNNLSDKVNNTNGYKMEGKLEIYRGEDLYTYNITSEYQKKDNFKVTLENTTNKHVQVILRNEDGVYVVTPSLNKSFKFDSVWPYNNSQIYLLQPIVSDLQNDDNLKLKEKNNEYILSFKANYINDKSLVEQKIYLDKDLTLKKVEVLNKDNDVIMRMKVSKIDMNYKCGKKCFNLEKIIDSKDSTKDDKKEAEKNSDKKNNEESVASISEDILYPMYLPVDTYLDSKQVIKSDTNERAILNFTGSSPFTIIESTLSNDKVNYIEGEPYLIYDTVGAMTDNSLSWISNDKEYYLTSSVMNMSDLLNVAQSLNVNAVGK